MHCKLKIKFLNLRVYGDLRHFRSDRNLNRLFDGSRIMTHSYVYLKASVKIFLQEKCTQTYGQIYERTHINTYPVYGSLESKNRFCLGCIITPPKSNMPLFILFQGYSYDWIFVNFRNRYYIYWADVWSFHYKFPYQIWRRALITEKTVTL